MLAKIGFYSWEIGDDVALEILATRKDGRAVDVQFIPGRDVVITNLVLRSRRSKAERWASTRKTVSGSSCTTTQLKGGWAFAPSTSFLYPAPPLSHWQRT